MADSDTPGAETRRDAARLGRGVCRTFDALGYGALTEFTLRSGRRVDVIGVNGASEVAIAEIKTSEADYRADRKWQEYLDFCDRFYFAVPAGFPWRILPAECGLIVADAYAGAILRTAPHRTVMRGTRRRALILRFALAASGRLRRATDTEPGG